jgi:hypothetical protein
MPNQYPLPVAWSGILVDDEGHPADIADRASEALRIIWKEQADEVEATACDRLGVKSLREYFSRPAGFFADHLRRYSKSARKAPIYWPLSTASGGYTLWLYYSRLSSQTLYTAINDFVEPKLKEVAKEEATLRAKGASRSRSEEKHLEVLLAFESELAELRDVLQSLASTYKPNQDDGVQITAAPLWQLFRFKPWQKVLRDTWVKLENEEYDWSHLAMSYWPERVAAKCRRDKSLAIAHGLEDLYLESDDAPKGRRRGTASVREL